jgi:phospholipid-translocating ATPase
LLGETLTILSLSLSLVSAVFPMFGASTPEIAMLPLVAVLVMTGIKDGLEDWRRARLDNEVNNSAATKLGSWKNVNQPTDPRNWIERLLGLGNGECSEPGFIDGLD